MASPQPAEGLAPPCTHYLAISCGRPKAHTEALGLSRHCQDDNP